MSFTIVVSWQGECCTKPHLWVQTSQKATEQEAVDEVVDAVRRENNWPFNYVVFDGEPNSGPVLELPEDKQEPL